MKKITLFTLSVMVATIISSCCCQEQDMPPLRKMPRFNDIDMPAGQITPYKGKK